jgi:hypothetical protein
MAFPPRMALEREQNINGHKQYFSHSLLPSYGIARQHKRAENSSHTRRSLGILREFSCSVEHMFEDFADATVHTYFIERGMDADAWCFAMPATYAFCNDISNGVWFS